MLPRKNRLDLKKEFFQIKKNGKLVEGKFFSFLYNLQQTIVNKQESVFAFVVSKKIDKRATRRNRIKRLLSEVVRNFLPEIKPGVEGVFLAKKEILGKSFSEVKTEAEKIFKKESLLQ